VSYIELHTASAFSFLRGASLPETLVERAAALGYPAVALLDRDGVYGAPRFHAAAKAAGLRALIGAELTIALSIPTPDRDIPTSPPRHIATWTLPLLVASQEGWRNLCRLVTRMKLRAPKGEGALTLDDFDGYTSGLIALAGRPLVAADRYGVGSIASSVSLAATTSMSSCSGICVAIRKTTTTRWRLLPKRFACRSWRQAVCALPRQKNVRSSMCSRRFVSTRRSTPLAVCSPPTPNAT
jgi:hypothetical protein